jgi:hypothetical protein
MSDAKPPAVVIPTGEGDQIARLRRWSLNPGNVRNELAEAVRVLLRLFDRLTDKQASVAAALGDAKDAKARAAQWQKRAERLTALLSHYQPAPWEVEEVGTEPAGE